MTALSRSLSCWVASLAFHGAVGPVSVPVGELDFVLAEVVEEVEDEDDDALVAMPALALK